MNKIFDAFDMELNKTTMVGRRLFTLTRKYWVKEGYGEPQLLVYWSYNRRMDDSNYKVEHSKVSNAVYLDAGAFYPTAKETWHTWERGPV